MVFYIRTQAELDAIPRDAEDSFCIDFGTKENPAIVKYQCRCAMTTINNSVVVAQNDVQVIACDNSIVYAHDNSFVNAHDNSEVYAYDKSEVYANHNSKIYAYDNSKVWVWNDKCIISINNNAIITSPNILCSGAELLDQCNGSAYRVRFSVSNVPDKDKDSVFQEFYTTNGRVFILTIRGISYYCVYDFNAMSVEFYTMDLERVFENVADDAVLAYYLDNVLIPALVNTKFDKSAKSNII